MYIAELDRELTGRLLAIYTGINEDGTAIDMPEHQRQAYIQKWRRERGLLRQGQQQQQPIKKCNCNKT
jgi:ABC-type ATPase involved in cell division